MKRSMQASMSVSETGSVTSQGSVARKNSSGAASMRAAICSALSSMALLSKVLTTLASAEVENPLVTTVAGKREPSTNR